MTSGIPGHGDPARRALSVYAFDPQLANTLDRIGTGVVKVEVPWEPLEVGPAGARVMVVDFDGGRFENGSPTTVYYVPVDLDDPRIAGQGGLAPSEADPRFHQQMVYAVAMRVFEAFDTALGRRVRPMDGILRLHPHAHRKADAFYDPRLRAVLFGYYEAGVEDLGPNLPGQFVYTCLSHDIIAHEVGHAIMHRMRPWLLERTNVDVAAFQEAVADIVAIFLHFTLPGVVSETVATTRTQLHDPGPLVDLAQQFGYTTGRQGALRTAIDLPDPSRYRTERVPHYRGAILVAAVFSAFLTIYRRRIADLLRLATGGTGQLPPGALHPDLVNRVTREAIRSSRQVLTMCVRAIDYLPPVDVTFSDYLRAIVTADRDLFPTDSDGMRTAFIDAFRRRGILPRDVFSLADASLSWPIATWAPDIQIPARASMLARDVLSLDPSLPWQANRPRDADRLLGEAWRRGDLEDELEEFANTHFAKLSLADPESGRIKVEDFQTVFAYDEDRAPRVSFIVQYTQTIPQDSAPDLPKDLLEKSVRRGTTLVADGNGRPRFVISKPAPGPGVTDKDARAGTARLAEIAEWYRELQDQDPLRPFGYTPRGSSPVRLDIAAIHETIW